MVIVNNFSSTIDLTATNDDDIQRNWGIIQDNLGELKTYGLGKDDTHFTSLEVTASRTLLRNNRPFLIKVDSSSAITLTLPDYTDSNLLKIDDIFIIKDASKNSQTHNITLNPNGGTIEGDSNNLVLANNGKCIMLQYAGSGEWKILFNTFKSPEISSVLAASKIVETDSDGLLTTAAKNSAYNKDFGAVAGNVPDIASGLAADRIVETNGSYQLITAEKHTAYNKDFGTGSGDVCEGDDGRLSDSRDPNSHASSHKSGGGDEIKLNELSANGKTTFYASTTSEASQNIPAGDIPTAPENGDIINSNPNGFAVFEKDLLAHLAKCFFTATSSAGPSNTTSETSILGGSVAGSSTKTLPANWWKPGRTLIIEAHGYLFTDASPVNLTNKTKLAGTTVIDTGAIALPASLSNQGFNVRAIITCRTTGASGNFVGHVIVNYRINSGTTYTASLPVTFTADTTASMAVDCTMQFSAAAANNVCVARQSKMCFEM